MDHPFQRWVDAARPRGQLWRTLIGTLIILAAWFGWVLGFVLLAVGGGLITPNALGVLMGQTAGQLTYLEAVVTTAVLFATFWGLWIGVWLAVTLVHRRGLATIISHDGRLTFGEVGVGMLLAAGYLVIGVAMSSMSGAAPVRSSLPLETWLISLAPLVILIFLQSAGEELFFRGYLVQQLAARVRNPLVWGFLPSLGFGLAHASNAGADAQFAAYYVFAATMLGLVMTATVWRTGGLSVAMGFHLVNNIGALLVVSVAGVSPPISLFVLSYGDMIGSAPTDLLMLGLLLAFVLSPFAPLPRGQPLRRNDTRAAP